MFFYFLRFSSLSVLNTEGTLRTGSDDGEGDEEDGLTEKHPYVTL